MRSGEVAPATVHITVVIPALNEEGTIGDTVDRLGDQLERGDRVFVLDNGSDDDTFDIAQERGHVRAIRTDGSLSLPEVRQVGAEMANTEIVATIDADTVPGEGWIDRIRQHFLEDEDLDVVWGVARDRNGVPVRDFMGKFLPLLGGASGCNTAFRRATFLELEHGYLDTPYPVYNGFEDWALVQRLSRVGKSLHDPALVVNTSFPREKYQTIPMVVGGAVAAGVGLLVPDPVGRALQGVGVSLVGTELTYESMSGTSLHHDQAGLVVAALSPLLGPAAGPLAFGAGAGLVGHHALTEGVSAFPTDLFRHTDRVVVRTDGDGAGRVTVQPTQADVRLSQKLLVAGVGALVGGLGVRAARLLR